MNACLARLGRRTAVAMALAIFALGNIGTGLAQNGNTPAASASTVDAANPLVGTAPLDRQELLGNAPPPGEERCIRA